MRIPTGNFGYSVPEPVDNSAVARATDRLGQIVSGIGQQRNEQAQALARARDASAYQEHALAVDQLKAHYAERIDSGEIPYQDAQAAFESDAAKIQTPTPTARDPVAAEALTRGTQMSVKRASLDIAHIAVGARDKDMQAQGIAMLDTLGKRVSVPGADVDAINAQADAVAPVLRSGGVSEAQVSRTIQNFKDANWYNQATQAAMQSRESIPALKQLEHDLTASDGFYAEKMDTEKRNAVLSQVIGHRLQLENRLQSMGDRREARAERAATQIERQISSGVPATADMWSEWGDTIKGTSVEPEFKELVANEREIQNTLRAPIADQVRLVQQRQADLLQNGGSVVQKANADRLERAVSGNIKMLRETPLLFAEQRLGDTNEPVNLATPGNENTQQANSVELQDRASRIRALSKQFGAPIPMRPLLPQEAKQLSQILEQGSPTQVAQLMNDLRDNAGSSDVFRGMMNQVAPDQPVKALAGVLSSMQRDLTTASHWFKPDETITARDVAATMLEGDRLINRSSTAKAEDGKPQNRLVLPETKPLQEAFESVVGDNFRGDPQGKERAFQAAHAFYVGRVAQTGVRAKDGSSADKALMELAVKSTLGDIVDYNGHGNVQAPWGMSSGDFEDRAEKAIRLQAKTAGIADQDVNENIRALGLDNGPSDGIYVLTRAGQWLYDGRGNPVLVDIRPPDARDARGFINRTGQ